MTNPRLIIKILNLLNGILMVVFLVKILHLFAFLNPIKVYHLAIVLVVVYGLKSWIEIANNVSDPLRENKITNMLFNAGFGIIVLGVLFKIMHWPYVIFFFLVGSCMVLLSYLLSFVLDRTLPESNPNILDDLNEGNEDR